MDELELLSLAMVANPEEDTPRMMYTDELIGRTGCRREMADAIASEHWLPALMSLHISQAVMLTTGEDDRARRLQWLIHRALPEPTGLMVSVLITTGYLKPVRDPVHAVWNRCVRTEDRHTRPRNISGNPVRVRPLDSFILVGSMWVLQVAHEWGYLDREPTPEPNDQEADE